MLCAWFLSIHTDLYTHLAWGKWDPCSKHEQDKIEVQVATSGKERRNGLS